MSSRHVSVVVHADPAAVYAFVRDVDHLPLWAAGLASSPVRRAGEDLLVDSPMGEVTVRFVGPNELGVLDHDVTLPSGTTVTNPMRVMRHPEGAEVVFTVRQLDLTDDELERDARTVGDDLRRLKALLEP